MKRFTIIFAVLSLLFVSSVNAVAILKEGTTRNMVTRYYEEPSSYTKKKSSSHSKSKRSSKNKAYRIEGNRIVTGNKWVVIDFYTDWCRFCPPYKEVFDRVSHYFTNKAVFIRINAEKKSGIANYYNIHSYPKTIILYPNDRGVAGEINGLVDENYLYNYLSRFF